MLGFVKTEISKINGIDSKPSKIESVKSFFSRARYAIKLIFLEKEILFFMFLKLAFIIAGICLWMQIFDVIPSEYLDKKLSSNPESEHIYYNSMTIYAVWSLICLVVFTLPTSILTASIGAVHFLHKNNEESTIRSSVRIASNRLWFLWIFSVIDNYITISRVFGKSYRRKLSFVERAASFIMYQAWKIGTMGIIPGVILGKNLVSSGRESILLAKDRIFELIKLRVGYYVFRVCIWILFWGVLIACAYLFGGMNRDFALLFVFSLLMLRMFIRSIYIISICDIYSDFLIEKGKDIALPTNFKIGYAVLLVFTIITIGTASVGLFPDELGVTEFVIHYIENYIPE